MSFVCRDCSAEMRLRHNDAMLLVEVDGNRSTNNDTDQVLHAVRRALGDAAQNVQKITPTVTNTNTTHKILLTKSKPIDLSSLTTSINTQLAGMPDNSLHVRRAREFGSQCSHFNCPGCDICRSCALRPTMREINTAQNWINHAALMTDNEAFSAEVATITQKLKTLHGKTRTALDLYTSSEYQQALRQLHVLSLQNKDMLQTLQYWDDFEHFLDNLYKTLPRMHKLDLEQDFINNDNAMYIVIRMSNIRSQQFKTNFAGKLCYVMFSMCANHDVMHPGMITVMDTQASSKQFQRNTLIDVLVRIDCADAAALDCIYSMSYSVQSRAWIKCELSNGPGRHKEFRWLDEDHAIAKYVVPENQARQIYNAELEAAIQKAAKTDSSNGFVLVDASNKIPASVFDTDYIVVEDQSWCAYAIDSTFECRVQTDEILGSSGRQAAVKTLELATDDLENWFQSQTRKTNNPILKLPELSTRVLRTTCDATIKAFIEQQENTSAFLFEPKSGAGASSEGVLLWGLNSNLNKNTAEWNEFLKRHQNIRNIFEPDHKDGYLGNKASDTIFRFVSQADGTGLEPGDQLKNSFFATCHFNKNSVGFTWKKMAFILCYDMLENADTHPEIQRISSKSWFETMTGKKFKLESVMSNVHGSVFPVNEARHFLKKFHESCFRRQRAAYNVGSRASFLLSSTTDHLNSNVEFLMVSLCSKNRKDNTRASKEEESEDSLSSDSHDEDSSEVEEDDHEDSSEVEEDDHEDSSEVEENDDDAASEESVHLAIPAIDVDEALQNSNQSPHSRNH